jgi:hypothetical protein
MSWAGIANNQCISFNNLQDAVTTGVFALKNTIPVSTEQITKADADYYVYIDTAYGPYASKASNQLVVKSNLQPPPTTSTTTTTTTAACQQLFLYPNNVNPCDHFNTLTLFDTDNALAPTILYVSGGCGVTPVAGGNLWYSQGAGADSYQVDNSGNIISTFPC